MTQMESPGPVCLVHDLGLIEYSEAWRLQDQLARQVAQGESSPVLLLLEHPHTYTFGRRASQDNLIWDEAELDRQGVAVHWVDRGGDVTYHGPGQLVGYPIIPLGTPGAGEDNSTQVDYVGYVRRLEEVLILTLISFGIPAGQIPGLTGVWVQPDVASRCPRCTPEMRKSPSKIASIGVKVDARGVSRHGFALNVAPEMSYWQGIVPCGIKNVSMVSLADLLPAAPSIGKVKQQVVTTFGTIFGYNMVEKAKMV